MFKWFEKFFAFSRQELTGICALGVFLFLLWLAPKLITPRNNDAEDMTKQISEIDRFLASVSKPTQSTRKTDSSFARKVLPATDIDYFIFDPNGLSVADWKRLGLSEGQIRVIKNYETKGGRFGKKEDLKKIYSLSEKDYARLEPYIQIQQPKTSRRTSPLADTSRHETPRLSISLQGVDSVELQQLPGIGPVFASRIVRFRDGLGGFHHLTQLMDVYGMDSARFERIKDYLYLDSGSVKKIPVNTADYHRFAQHPYISSKLANALVQYRRQHGPYQSLADLLQIAIMDEEIFRKIVPYLTTSDD